MVVTGCRAEQEAGSVAVLSAGRWAGKKRALSARDCVMRGKVLAFAILLSVSSVQARAHTADDTRQRAIDYCRRYFQVIRLSEDSMVLCFDGFIGKKPDMTPFNNLRDNGYFVVRSTGGYLEPAVEISEVLREKKAKVVIYDYCLSACANYFFVASDETYVSERSIVAWHGGPVILDCRYPDRYVQDRNWPERPWTTEEVDESCRLQKLHIDFFSKRRINDNFIYYPQSRYTKKIGALIAQGAGYVGRSVFWMWNPRYYANYFKLPEITYNLYPQDELEVDEILEKWRLPSMRLIYDP